MSYTSAKACRRESRRHVGVSQQDLARVRDWVEREISFIPHEIFTQQNCELQFSKLRPSTLDQPEGARVSEPGITFVAAMVESRLLTPDEEVYLFLWMNYLKFRAERSRRRLGLNAPDLSLVRQIEADVAEANVVRNRIVQGNVRLLVSLAKKLAVSMDQMSELIGEATIPLIRAVELFDVGLGNRFSTYATWAARNQMLRCLKRARLASERMTANDQEWILQVADKRSSPGEETLRYHGRTEIVRRLLDALSERERIVIAARFGLDGQPSGQSLQDIANTIGLSKERVRQIVLRAVARMQEMDIRVEQWLP